MCPLPKAPSNFFTNIILHCRVLFYTFMDITVMFLSRDSFYWTYIISPPNAMVFVSRYRRLHSTSCTTARSCWCFVFCDKNGWKQKMMSGWYDDNDIVIQYQILSYNISLYGLVIFLSVSGFYQPHDVTFFGLMGRSPQTPTGALPLDPAGGLPSPRPHVSALPNQNLASVPVLRFWRVA